MVHSLHELRERTQDQWVNQAVQHYVEEIHDFDHGPLPSAKELTRMARQLLADHPSYERPRNSFGVHAASRHVHGACNPLGGQTLPTFSLLY